jgi:hypothetical protein
MELVKHQKGYVQITMIVKMMKNVTLMTMFAKLNVRQHVMNGKNVSILITQTKMVTIMKKKYVHYHRVDAQMKSILVTLLLKITDVAQTMMRLPYHVI